MKHKRLAQWSIGFVILIFLSQAYLIFRLFQVNYTYLNKVVSTITQDVYTKDLNSRLGKISTIAQPRVEIGSRDLSKLDTTGCYNIDAMADVDKTNKVTLLNISIEMILSESCPLKLTTIDSLASDLFERENIHADFCTRIVDLKKDSILEWSKPGFLFKNSRWLALQSKNIPLNFRQDKVLQLVMLNPLKAIFTQMTGMLVLSLLLCLFCIYCLYILQRTLARQKKLAQSKNDFYNQVSHELKRPVSVVYHAIDSLLNTKAIENVERRTRYMDVSMVELQRMTAKIDMILTMSMVEEGMFRLNKTDFNLPDLVEELKERYYIDGTKAVGFRVENELVNPLVNADRDHLFQCLSNLTDNAIKYSGENVQIIFRLFEENGSFGISVRDNGQGIHEKDLKRIFEKFERANLDKKSPGYGIGLSYVKQIMEMHVGSIDVRSEFGKWSEFTLHIPRMS
ncbi:MAG TPA: HAMP domain-containing sensor histidine kinase [Bacteroidales bacterium]